MKATNLPVLPLKSLWDGTFRNIRIIHTHTHTHRRLHSKIWRSTDTFLVIRKKMASMNIDPVIDKIHGDRNAADKTHRGRKEASQTKNQQKSPQSFMVLTRRCQLNWYLDTTLIKYTCTWSREWPVSWTSRIPPSSSHSDASQPDQSACR